MIKVVILVLTVWDTSAGVKLYEIERPFDDFSISGNHIEDCRQWGVREAHKLTDQFKSTHPWASSNVDCHWEWTPGAKA